MTLSVRAARAGEGRQQPVTTQQWDQLSSVRADNTTERGSERGFVCVVSDQKQGKGISSVQNVQKVKRIVFLRDLVRSAVCSIWIIQLK